jgi:hypothetical protein
MLLRAVESDVADVVAYCNTGTGIEQSRESVHETAAHIGSNYQTEYVWIGRRR